MNEVTANRKLRIVYRKLEDLEPYARNARTHSVAQIDKVKASLAEYGWTNPMLIAEGQMIAGHARLRAAREMQAAGMVIRFHDNPAIGPTVDLSHLTPEQRRAYVIADNRIAEDAGWDEELLREEMRDLGGMGFALELTGFERDEIDEILGQLNDSVADDGRARGELLKLIDITIADPRHAVERDQHFILSERHHLVVTSVMRGWPLWAPLLTEETIFCPYPGPFILFGKRADDHPLLLVQPDIYIAGHCLDRYANVHGDDAIVRVDK
jgi:hypothetical protein